MSHRRAAPDKDDLLEEAAPGLEPAADVAAGARRKDGAGGCRRVRSVHDGQREAADRNRAETYSFGAVRTSC
jgi:hypothetical protein